MTTMVAGWMVIVFMVLGLLVTAIYLFTGNGTGDTNRDLELNKKAYNDFQEEDDYEWSDDDLTDQLLGVSPGVTPLDELDDYTDYSYDD